MLHDVCVVCVLLCDVWFPCLCVLLPDDYVVVVCISNVDFELHCVVSRYLCSSVSIAVLVCLYCRYVYISWRGLCVCVCVLRRNGSFLSGLVLSIFFIQQGLRCVNQVR